MKMSDAARLGDFFVTVTGNCRVITEEHFPLMRDGAILCNAGHFDVEVDMEALKKYASGSYTARNNIEGYKLPNGNTVFVIAEGRLVNICAGDGHPAEIMDMSFAIQALSAEYMVRNRGKSDKMIVKVPREVDMEVARRKLGFWGCEIDALSVEQEKYMGSWQGKG
jgi:adenosylhomocysteinase